MFRKSALLFTLGASFALVGCDNAPLEPAFGITSESFVAFDINDDGFVTENEFTVGFAEEGLFDTFNGNLDGFVGADQFEDDFGDFNDFDTDGDLGLTEDELLGGMFVTFDTSFDGLVDEVEFETGLDLF